MGCDVGRQASGIAALAVSAGLYTSGEITAFILKSNGYPAGKTALSVASAHKFVDSLKSL